MPSRHHTPPAALLFAPLLAVLLAAGALQPVSAHAETPPERVPAEAGGAERTPAPAATPPAAVAPPLPIDIIVVRPQPVAPTISLSLRDADLVEVLRSFARIGGFDLVVDPAVRGTVTVELRDVRWQDALVVILRSQGLAAEVDGRIVGVRPLPLAARR